MRTRPGRLSANQDHRKKEIDLSATIKSGSIGTTGEHLSTPFDIVTKDAMGGPYTTGAFWLRYTNLFLLCEGFGCKIRRDTSEFTDLVEASRLLEQKNQISKLMTGQFKFGGKSLQDPRVAKALLKSFQRLWSSTDTKSSPFISNKRFDEMAETLLKLVPKRNKKRPNKQKVEGRPKKRKGLGGSKESPRSDAVSQDLLEIGKLLDPPLCLL
mmetsp:Transcript_11945/g.24256  ORF Transcript_11945/g.24256 Transcript_11945/m.24256 type:complete len:212 (-) Transcript_11945:100-735(-)